MKHLKRFNESLNDNEVDELRDFCETSLAYLLDDGYRIQVSPTNLKTQFLGILFSIIIQLPTIPMYLSTHVIIFFVI